MNINFYDISIEDMIRYYNCRKKIRSGMYKNGRTCIRCKFNIPIEKFRYLNNAEKRGEYIMKQKDGIFRQRVGYLIEQDICKQFNLYYNKRQQTLGYYDAYNDKTIYEIKASSIKNNTFIIRLNNHRRLVSMDGIYIFVSYKQKNKDKDLSVISDIEITNIKFIKAKDINISNKTIFMVRRSKPDKKYIHIYLSNIKNFTNEVI